MSLRQVLRRKKREYLLLAETAGGEKHEFKVYIDKDYRAHPDDYDNRAAVMEAAEHIWEENRKPSGDKDPDLFAINGITLAETLTYPDPDHKVEPGSPQKYRKIAIEFATVWHLRADAQLTIDLGSEITASGEAKMKLAEEALRRAGGNPARLLSSVADP